MITFFTIFFAIYGAANYYIGLRIWQALSTFTNQSLIYWMVVLILASSQILGRMGSRHFPGWLSDAFTLIGAYWMAAVYYLFALFAFWDLLRLFGKLSGLLSANSKLQTSPIPALIIVSLVGIALIYGSLNARNPHIKSYDITIEKNAGNLHELHAVMVADIHLGSIVDNSRLEGMVNVVNSLNPDIVFFAGDTIDENVDYFAEKNMPATLQRLKPRLGMFAVLGNHEYLGGNADQAVFHMQEAGVTVLRDQYVSIGNSLYIVGRDDKTRERFGQGPRQDLATIMTGINRSLPIILLDHQPYHLQEAQRNGIDLQLSGHTHHGQFFPNNLITQRIFEIDWGYLKKNSYHAIVSCGFGTWGPPIRIGSKPELIDIRIRFVPPPVQ